jgi:hypothetical protein
MLIRELTVQRAFWLYEPNVIVRKHNNRRNIGNILIKMCTFEIEISHIISFNPPTSSMKK